MRHDHLKRELDLLLLLVQNRTLTSDAICSSVDISRRSFYYYLDFFKEVGFKVGKYKQFYSISRESEFFQKLFNLVQFTDDEAVIMRKLIDGSEVKTQKMSALRDKLERFYDFCVLDSDVIRQRVSQSVRHLEEAIRTQRIVRLVNYSSNNSRTVSNRIVEPFVFLNNNRDIRCYEISSGINKTFRLSRIERVDILEIEWRHAEKHNQEYTDMFSFSGEKRYPIDLVLGQVAYNLLMEEYPAAAPCVAKRSDGKWNCHVEVCSYKGIGRFVIGLLDEIEILGDAGFQQYIQEKLQKYLTITNQ